MKPRCRLRHRLEVIWNVLVILARNQNENWPLILLTGSVLPFVMMSVVVRFGENANQARLTHLLAGNLVLSLLFGPLIRTAVHIAYLWERQVIEYFATMPIRKADFVAAILLNCLAQSLPGTLILLVLCHTLLGVRMVFHPLLVPIAVLTALAMAALGTCFGVIGREFWRARLMAEGCVMVTLLFSPVFAPLDRYPLPLRMLANVLPSTYAVRSLQDILAGTVLPMTWFNILVVAVFASVLLWIATRRLDWNVA